MGQGGEPIRAWRAVAALAAVLLAATCFHILGGGAPAPTGSPFADADQAGETGPESASASAPAGDDGADEADDHDIVASTGPAAGAGSAGSSAAPAGSAGSTRPAKPDSVDTVEMAEMADAEETDDAGDTADANDGEKNPGAGTKPEPDPAPAPAPGPVIASDTSPTEDGPAAWKLVWADEFDGNEINAANWTHQNDCWGGGNQELQCYTSSPANSFVKNGKLHIRVIEEQASGCNTSSGNCNPDQIVTRDYTSARLRTLNKRDFKYGRFEIRAKLPGGQGIWPAIWMMPTDNVFGGWARSGEIDIMEAVNLDTGLSAMCEGPCENRLHGTVHFGGPCCALNRHTSGRVNPPWDMTESFNTYGIEWRENQIRWFINGLTYRTLNQTAASCPGNDPPGCAWWTTESSEPAAPFNQRFHLIMNLAIGGQWPGPPNASTTLPQEMVVDHVRVYECSADPAGTGAGCSE